MPATMAVEIEIAPSRSDTPGTTAFTGTYARPRAQPWAWARHRPHVAVVNRPTADGAVPSLVFPELVEGCYELFDKGEDDGAADRRIVGGRVTFLDWPAEV